MLGARHSRRDPTKQRLALVSREVGLEQDGMGKGGVVTCWLCFAAAGCGGLVGWIVDWLACGVGCVGWIVDWFALTISFPRATMYSGADTRK